MKKLLFIFNPQAGKGQIKTKLMQILDIMVKESYEVTIYPTQGKEDARRLAEGFRWDISRLGAQTILRIH